MNISVVPAGPGGESSRPEPVATGREADAAHLVELMARSARGH